MFKALIVVALAALSGCASISDGTTQTIVFSLSPNEVRCVVSRENTELGSVSRRNPTITVSKGARDILAACKADGYEPKTQRLISSTQTAGVVGGIFLDLGIVDMLTGAMWKYPNNVSIALERLAVEGPTPAAVPAPAVSIMPAATAPAPMPSVTMSAPPIATDEPTQQQPTSMGVATFNPNAEVRAPPLASTSQDSLQAERLPASKACSPQPRAMFTGKGPGFESYTIACANGDQLMIRCEFGNCRVLR